MNRRGRPQGAKGGRVIPAVSATKKPVFRLTFALGGRVKSPPILRTAPQGAVQPVRRVKVIPVRQLARKLLLAPRLPEAAEPTSVQPQQAAAHPVTVQARQLAK